MTKDDKKMSDVFDKPFERNNYYFGKLMKAQDFETEQSYFNEKRWLINRMVHGSGVVCGLDVEPIGNPGGFDEVKIEPGLAIDCFGREILVCEPQVITIIPEASECDNGDKVPKIGDRVAVCLKFKECKTDSFTVLYGACNQKEKCQFNHIKDWFEIKVVPLKKKDKEEHPCKKEHFCPKRYGCNDDYKKSLNQLICDRLNDYPECCNHSCIILATLIFGLEGYVIESKYSARKLVYNNPLLYDLISCYHGDLPRVCDISWEHDAQLKWADFQDLVVAGLKVTFNKPMQQDSINTHTFQVVAITVDDSTGYRLLSFIPAKENKIHFENQNAVTTAIFKFDSEWIEEEVTKEEVKRSMVYSALADGAEFEIVLKGSSIFSEDGKALDGSFRGNLPLDKGKCLPSKKEPDLPSGTGTQGTDFISWFSVHHRHKQKIDIDEELEEEEYENK